MRLSTICATLSMLLIYGQQARAETLTFPLSIEYSGATTPAGSLPWLTALFCDDAGSVTLTLDATNITGSEFVGCWLFNLDPSLDPTGLTFTEQAKTGFFDYEVNLGINEFQAAGGSKFDIAFEFDKPGVGGDINRFGEGESLSLVITGIDTLTAGSFYFFSTESGGLGPFLTAAHVQGIGSEGEQGGWVTVPEPTTCTGATLAVLGLLAYGWRRRRKLTR